MGGLPTMVVDVDGVFAMGDAGEVEDGIKIFERVEAGVVAEGAFGAEFVEVDVAFENDFGGGGNFEIDGLALHQLDRLLAQESGDEIFLDVRRRGNDGGEGDALGRCRWRRQLPFCRRAVCRRRGPSRRRSGP